MSNTNQTAPEEPDTVTEAQSDLFRAVKKVEAFRQSLSPRDGMRIRQVDAVLESLYNAKYMLQMVKLDSPRPLAIQQIVDSKVTNVKANDSEVHGGSVSGGEPPGPAGAAS